MENEIQKYVDIVKHIKDAILRSQNRSVRLVNREILSLYYAIGGYISENSGKEFWGTGAIAQISEMLQKELPGLRGFSASSIRNMRQFFEEWQAYVNQQPTAGDLELNETTLLLQIHQPLAGKLNWEDFVAVPFSSHIEILNKTNLLEERCFYIHECVVNSWNKYQLREFMRSDLYGKRGSLPNNFIQTINDKRQIVKATKMFKEDYFLDFINVEPIGESYEDIDERELERQIVQNIQKFIMTFGNDFAFIGSQYRVIIHDVEQFIDLLFFNRELNALVAVELKAGKFKSSYLGQLNTYLSALDAKVKKPNENPSIGIILCRDIDNKSFVEFAIRDYDKPMGVATYRTNEEMPERYRNALPDVKTLHRLLENSEE